MGENQLSLMETNCEYTFGWNNVRETCGSAQSERNNINYFNECDETNDDDSEWCTLNTNGEVFFYLCLVAGLNVLIFSIPLSVVTCCSPKSCCNNGQCCRDNSCLDESCCGGLCLRNTAIIGMIINGVLYLIAIIIWAADFPVQDKGGEICSDIECDDIEWGSTWWGLLFIGIAYFILAAAITYKDGCKRIGHS